MKRFLSLQSEGLLGSAELVIEILQTEVARVALELTLLRLGHCDSVRIQAGGGTSVVLTMLAEDRVSKASVARGTDGSLSFALGINQVGYLQAVLLRAYRDEMAEVNHVHVEGVQAGQDFDLTLMFSVYQPPMSPEEVERLTRD